MANEDRLNEFNIDESLDNIATGLEGGSDDVVNFFEDLTSLDLPELDQEGQNISPLSALPEKEKTPPIAAEASKSSQKRATVNTSQKVKKQKKGGKKRSMPLLGWTFFMLLIAGGVGYYLWSNNYLQSDFLMVGDQQPFQQIDEPFDLLESISDKEGILTVDEVITKPKRNIENNTRLPSRNIRKGPILPEIGGNWRVKIASCTYQRCVTVYTNSLEKYDYPSESILKKKIPFKSYFLKIFINERLEKERAEKIVELIKQENDLGLNPYSVASQNGLYRVFIGLFPYNSNNGQDLIEKIEREVKGILVQNSDFGEEMLVNAVVEVKTVQQTQIYLGEYSSKSVAESALRDIQRISGYETSYVLEIKG